MRDELVAGKYALALFNVAQKRNELEAVEADLQSLGALNRATPRFRRTLESPTVTTEFKRQMLGSTLKGRVSATTFSTLNLMLDKNRIGFMDELAAEYARLLRQHRGVVRAVAFTASPLEPAQVDRLKSALGKISGKTIELDSRVDENLLGGVVVNLEDKILDGSVRRGLDDLRETLRKVRVL